MYFPYQTQKYFNFQVWVLQTLNADPNIIFSNCLQCFCIFDPKNGLLDPKNLLKESNQHKNWAKFHLSCFQRFGNRFGTAEGAAPFKA